MSPPFDANQLRLLGLRVRLWRVVAATCAGAGAGAALGLAAATTVTPTWRASAQVEFVQASGTVPLSDAARDARIDGFVEAARGLSAVAATTSDTTLDRAGPPPPTEGGAAAVPAHQMRAERIGATSLVRLSVDATTPADAHSLVASAADTLIRRSLVDRIAAIAPPDAALLVDLEAARSRAEQADRALVSFRSRADGVMPAGEAEIAGLRASAVTARGDAAAAAARSRAAYRGIIVPAASVGQNGTASLGELRTQRAEVARRVAVLADRFTVDYPALVAARAESATLERAIAGELAGLSGSALADATAAEARAAALRRGVAGAESRRARGIIAEAEIGRLQRNADAAREAWRLLNLGVTQRNTERSLARPELRLVVPPAMPVAPVSPDRLLLALFGGLAAGAAALLAMLWVERRRVGALRFEF